jgi:AraC-like DNA-binding protein
LSKRIHRVTQHRSGIPGVEAMTLFSNHEFPRHSHDHFGIGLMTAGAQRSWSIVGQVESRAGDVIMCNPGEMHDGIPAGPGGPERGARGWQILYFDPSLMDDDVSQEERGELIVPPVVRDPRLSANVASLFALLAGGQALKSRKMHHRGQVTADLSPTLQNAKNQGLAPMKHFAVEEALVGCLMQVSERHRLGRRADVPTSPSVAAAICRLDDAPELPITLTELASLSGVSRFQLLRGFAREVGTTPHAYVIQRRARLARQHLAAGKSPADAALLAGFADQSHLTRAFVRHFGVTPARYRAVVSRNFVQDE